MLSHLVGYMEFLFLKLVLTFFACVKAATLPKGGGVSIYSFTIHTMLECIVVLCFWNIPSPSKYLIDLVASHHGC
jgi:hypothetical protein